MRWFINSTKETSGFNDNNNLQEQIDILNTGLAAHHISINAQRNDLEKIENRISNSLHDKGIQINNILKHQGNQDDRIAELEKGMELAKELLRAAFNTITDLENKVKALENRNMPQQTIPEAKAKKMPKFRRLRNTFGDAKFTNVYAIANGYAKAGFKQDAIAAKLNGLGFKTPYGMDFTARHVSDLLCNPVQKARFMAGKDKKAFL